MSYKPQTIRQAKAEYKKTGGTVRLSDAETRRLERQVELDRRAQRIQYREHQRKLQQKRKLEQEEREREMLCETGIGLATQLAGFNHTQVQMKRGMEAFLGISKKRKDVSGGARRSGDAAASPGVEETGADVNQGDCVVGGGQIDVVSVPRSACTTMSEGGSNTSDSKTGEKEEEKEEEGGEKEDPWDNDQLDDGTMCTLIATVESPHESSSFVENPGKLPVVKNSSFNISFSFSDVDEAIFAAEHDTGEHFATSLTAKENSDAQTPEPMSKSMQNSMADLCDEFVASNSQILRELT